MSTSASSITEKYLRYAPVRDVVFVLGAGTSYADGVPLQKEILPMLLDGGIPEIADAAIGKELKRFIEENFYVQISSGDYPSLEAVFGFMDYFIQQQESLSAGYPYETIVHIKENLIKAIHYIVNLKADLQSPVYHRFWEHIVTHNRNVSFITLNYDTLLEQAFEPLYPEIGYIDYCIPLMNYEKRPELKEYQFWTNPQEPVWIERNRKPTSFKIIKLHGSLNWKYCNCCNQVLLTTWDSKIDLNRGVFVGYTRPEKEEYDYVCPLDKTGFKTLIMPPSYMKTLRHPVISRLFSEASFEIRAARKIVFIGYSLSDADLHIRALLKKHLDPETEVVVVNGKVSETLKHRYCALAGNVRFQHTSFENLVRDAHLIDRLIR